MKKLAVILIDGLDPEVLQKHIESLPNLKELVEKGTFKKLESVIPPDSIPAWATIYTGVNPGEHGIFESIDYLKIKNQDFSMDNSVFKGKTFWDAISNNGDTVGIVNPFIAYPSWDVNGYMLSGPVFESGNVSCNVKEVIEKYNIPPLGGIVDYPCEKSYEEFLQKSLSLMKEQNELALNLFKNENTSFFFYGNLIVDRIKHFYWKFTENNKKSRSEFLSRSVLNVYREVDNLLGKIKNVFQGETNILLISDHGHQRRVVKSFCLNEWLRRKGYIQTRFGVKTIVEVTKNIILSMLSNLGHIDLALKISKFIPNVRKLKNSEYINNSKSDFYVPKFAGMNPYGGICINKENVNENVIVELMDKLGSITDGGVKIIEWIERRENLYKGRFVNQFPDIVFKLNDNYGINRSFYTGKVFGKNHFFSRISGGHRRDGVFLCSEKVNGLNDRAKIKIEEIHKIILDLFYDREVG